MRDSHHQMSRSWNVKESWNWSSSAWRKKSIVVSSKSTKKQREKESKRRKKRKPKSRRRDCKLLSANKRRPPYNCRPCWKTVKKSRCLYLQKSRRPTKVILTARKNTILRIVEIVEPKEQNTSDRRGRKNRKLASPNRLPRKLNREPKIWGISKPKDKKTWRFRDRGRSCSDNWEKSKRRNKEWGKNKGSSRMRGVARSFFSFSVRPRKKRWDSPKSLNWTRNLQCKHFPSRSSLSHKIKSTWRLWFRPNTTNKRDLIFVLLMPRKTESKRTLWNGRNGPPKQLNKRPRKPTVKQKKRESGKSGCWERRMRHTIENKKKLVKRRRFTLSVNFWLKAWSGTRLKNSLSRDNNRWNGKSNREKRKDCAKRKLFVNKQTGFEGRNSLKTRRNERGCPKFQLRRRKLTKDCRKYLRKMNAAEDRSKLNQKLCAFRKRRTAHLSWAYKQPMRQNRRRWPNDKLVSNWSNLKGFKRKNTNSKWRDNRKWRKKNRRERCSLSRPKKKLRGSSRCKLIMPSLSLKDSKKWGLKKRRSFSLFRRAMRRKKDRERPNCKYKRRLSVKNSWSLQKSTRPSRWWGRKSSPVTNCWKPKGNWGLVGSTKRGRVPEVNTNPTDSRGTWVTSRWMRNWIIHRRTHRLNTTLLLKLSLIFLSNRSSKYAMTSLAKLQSSSDPEEETYWTQKSWNWCKRTMSLSRWSA